MKTNNILKQSTIWLIISFCLAFFASKAEASVDWTTKHRPRIGANLVKNPSFDGMSGWTIQSTKVGSYDSSVSKTSGSGSFKLTSFYEHKGILSDYIPVEPGKTYTFAWYMRWSRIPSQFVRGTVFKYDKNKKNIGYQNTGPNYGVSKVNTWEETVKFFPAKEAESNIAYVRLRIARRNAGASSLGNIWIDDVYFGEGMGFEQPPTPKQAFEGTYTRVDELGNFEIFRNGKWEPFFPLMMYHGTTPLDQSRINLYSRQGFNTHISGTNPQTIQLAKNAVSDFNPDGMMTVFGVSGWVREGNSKYNNTSLLESKLKEIKNKGLMDGVLCYYWDNENHWDEWSALDRVFNALKKIEVDINGKRMHPIYALQGNEGTARTFAAQGWTDITGTYMTAKGSGGAGSGTPRPLVIMDMMQNNPNSSVFGQFNGLTTTAGDMRRILYRVLIDGGKAMGFYADPIYQTGKPIETALWWDEFPKLRREIDALMPLIRQPHWTAWKLTATPSYAIDFGTRDYQGEGYVIVSNPNESSKKILFTIQGLPYTPQSVQDYFTGEKVVTISNSSFSITLPGYGTGVYRLSQGGTPSSNNTPIAKAGTDKSVSEGTKSASLDGSGSDDPDGDVLSYQWTQVSGPPVTLYNANKIIANFVAPEIDEDTELVFLLRVSDGEFADSDSVTITVQDQTSPPPPEPGKNEISAKTIPESIIIDGRLDEWPGANSVSFTDDSGRGTRDNTAKAYALWDDTYLYIAFQVEDTELAATETAGDGKVWRDDAIELFLDTQNNESSALDADDYQFIVNLNGAVYDSRQGDSTWDSTLQSAVNLAGTLNDSENDAGYTIELAIPWSDVGSKPEVDAMMGIDFAVDDKDSGDGYQYFDWADISPFAQPDKWSKITYREDQTPIPDNRAPVADAGSDREVSEGIELVELGASGPDDPDGDALSYQWTQVSDPAVSLNNPDEIIDLNPVTPPVPSDAIVPIPTPEPGTLLLLGVGLIGVIALRRRARKRL